MMHVLDFQKGFRDAVGLDSQEPVKVGYEDGTVGSSGQRVGRQKQLVVVLHVSAIARAQRRLHHFGLVPQVDGGAVALLQDPRVEIVLVLHAQRPKADIGGVVHPVTGQLGRLHVPHDVVLAAVGVLVAHANRRSRNSVNALKKQTEINRISPGKLNLKVQKSLRELIGKN